MVNDVSARTLHSDDVSPVGGSQRRVGGWSIMGDRVAVEAICRSGLDFVGIDGQHGFFAFDGAATAIQVANLCRVPCLVRVAAGQVDWIPRYLDAGADGIVVAMVSTAGDARRAVALSCYQPEGQRSYGGGKRNGVGDEAIRETDSRVPEVFAMIETAGALHELDEIAATAGLAGLYVGPVDLGLAMGRPYPLPSDDAAWREALGRVIRTCEEHGIRSGMFATDGEDAREWLSFGFRDIVLSSDIALLRRALSKHSRRAREPVTAADPLRPSVSADPYAGR